MRKPNNANKFKSRLARRESVVSHLKALNDPEARKVLKQMNTMNYGGPKANAKGMWAPRSSSPRPCKCSIKGKTRGQTTAAKRIMRGLA